MYCKNCNREYDDGVSICEECGALLSDGNGQPTESHLPEALMPMKWYKFLIYFLLFAMALLDFVSGLFGMLGNYLYLDEAGKDITDFVHTVYPGLKMLDAAYGAGTVMVSFYALFVRFKLSEQKKDALKSFYMYCAIPVIMTAVRDVIGYLIVDPKVLKVSNFQPISMMLTFAVGAVYFYLNVIYFRKRKQMFIY